jgi:hypothetical protein
VGERAAPSTRRLALAALILLGVIVLAGTFDEALDHWLSVRFFNVMITTGHGPAPVGQFCLLHAFRPFIDLN